MSVSVSVSELPLFSSSTLSSSSVSFLTAPWALAEVAELLAGMILLATGYGVLLAGMLSLVAGDGVLLVGLAVLFEGASGVPGAEVKMSRIGLLS